MPFTATLRRGPPRFPLEIHPLARLHGDGRIEILQAAFPPLGPAHLVLWRPGGDPPFQLVQGDIMRGWRFDGPPVEGFILLWSAPGDPPQAF